MGVVIIINVHGFLRLLLLYWYLAFHCQSSQNSEA